MQSNIFYSHVLQIKIVCKPNNHSSIECITNYGAKFNFIGIKKIEGVPKIFLKGRQINFF